MLLLAWVLGLGLEPQKYGSSIRSPHKLTVSVQLPSKRTYNYCKLSMFNGGTSKGSRRFNRSLELASRHGEVGSWPLTPDVSRRLNYFGTKLDYLYKARHTHRSATFQLSTP